MLAGAPVTNSHVSIAHRRPACVYSGGYVSTSVFATSVRGGPGHLPTPGVAQLDQVCPAAGAQRGGHQGQEGAAQEEQHTHLVGLASITVPVYEWEEVSCQNMTSILRVIIKC